MNDRRQDDQIASKPEAAVARRPWRTPYVILASGVNRETASLKGIFATPEHYSPGLQQSIS